MKNRFLALALVLASASITISSCRLTSPVEPALDHDFPDPTVIRAHDGNYYAYATQGFSEDGQLTLLNIQVARSRDLKSWEHLGEAMPAKPEWADQTQKFWAPHVSRVAGKYVMYFSAEPNSTKPGLCLGVAVADSPEGPFVDKGGALKCGNSFENIDPMLFDDPVSGKLLMYWGSGFKPIRVQEMTTDGLEFAPGSQAIELLAPRPKTKDPHDYTALVEGAWVVYRAPHYYLFFSGDNCCNPNPHYAVLVARSTSAMGPFEIVKTKLPGNTILASYDRFLAPGHNSVIEDDDGQSWMLFHAIDTDRPNVPRVIPGDRDVRRVLMSAPLDWTADGPAVRH